MSDQHDTSSICLSKTHACPTHVNVGGHTCAFSHLEASTNLDILGSGVRGGFLAHGWVG